MHHIRMTQSASRSVFCAVCGSSLSEVIFSLKSSSTAQLLGEYPERSTPILTALPDLIDPVNIEVTVSRAAV